MPSRRSTCLTVRARILRSSEKLRCSTYQTSYSNFACQDKLLRPWTCAHPVIPGLTSLIATGGHRLWIQTLPVHHSAVFVSNKLPDGFTTKVAQYPFPGACPVLLSQSWIIDV